MPSCVRCDADVGHEESHCSTCGLRSDRWTPVLANLAPLGVATLLGCLALELSLHMAAFLPATGQAQVGTFAGLWDSVVRLGNLLLTSLSGYLLSLVVGLAAGTYALPRKWWVRAAVGGLAGLLAACTIQLGGVLSWLEPRPMSLPVVGAAAIGAILAGFIRPAFQDSALWAKVWPRWLGAAKALLWVPLLLAFIVLGTYVAIAILLTVVTVFMLLFVAKLVFGGAGASALSRAQSQSSQPEQRDSNPWQFSQERFEREQKAEEQARQEKLKERRNVGKHYDEDGRFIGATDENGSMRDARGNNVGYVDEQGRVWQNGSSVAVAYRDDQGKVYDHDGTQVGRTDGDGRHYTREGHNVGRTERE